MMNASMYYRPSKRINRQLVVDSLNYAFEYGELSNSQKQAVITLIEKKEKDKRLVKN